MPTTNNIIDRLKFKGIPTALCLWLSVILGGCAPAGIDSQLQQYSQRLANVLDVAPPQLPTPAAETFPDKRQLQQSIEQQNLNLIVFSRLQNCSAGTLLAERNSGLGKVQLPSSRYLYEVSLLEQLPYCSLSSAQDQSDLADIITSKQQQLPKVWANMIQGSDEILRGVHYGQGFISATIDDGLAETKAALSYLMALPQAPKAEAEKLEYHLQQLDGYHLPARMWRSQRWINTQLPAITDWLKSHGEDINCADSQRGANMTYINNVFQLFFIDKIQVVASQLNRYHYQLAPVLDGLIEAPHIHSDFKRYVQQQQVTEYNRFKQVIKDHVEQWQMLLKRCDLQPG